MLTLRFKKTLESDATLTLERSDGSSTWARIGSGKGVGALRDIARVVVERQLMLANGILGQVTLGASLTDMESLIARSHTDALLGDVIAGMLVSEVQTRRLVPLDAFNATVQERCATLLPGFRAPDLTPLMIHAIRSEFTRLRREWEALEPGATLELRFGRAMPRAGDRDGTAGSSS